MLKKVHDAHCVINILYKYVVESRQYYGQLVQYIDSKCVVKSVHVIQIQPVEPWEVQIVSILNSCEM